MSILAEDGEKTAHWLATRGRPLDGQLDDVPHRPGPVTRAPLLDGALATMECQTFAVYDGGTTASSSAGSPPWTARQDRPARGPLIHHAGRYRRLDPGED